MKKSVVAAATVVAVLAAVTAATAGSYRQVWSPAGEISLCPIQPDGKMRVYPLSGGQFVQWEATLPLILGDEVRGIVLPVTGNREPGRMIVRLDGVKIVEIKTPPYRFSFPVARQFHPPLDPGLLHQLEAYFEQSGRRPLAAAPTLKFYVSEPMVMSVPAAILASTGGGPVYVPQGTATATEPQLVLSEGQFVAGGGVVATPDGMRLEGAITDGLSGVTLSVPKIDIPPGRQSPKASVQVEAMAERGKVMETQAGFARIVVSMTDRSARPVGGKIRVTVSDGSYKDIAVNGETTIRVISGRYAVQIHGAAGEWLQPRGQRLQFDVRAGEMINLRFIRAADAAQKEAGR